MLANAATTLLVISRERRSPVWERADEDLGERGFGNMAPCLFCLPCLACFEDERKKESDEAKEELVG